MKVYILNYTGKSFQHATITFFVIVKGKSIWKFFYSIDSNLNNATIYKKFSTTTYNYAIVQVNTAINEW